MQRWRRRDPPSFQRVKAELDPTPLPLDLLSSLPHTSRVLGHHSPRDTESPKYEVGPTPGCPHPPKPPFPPIVSLFGPRRLHGPGAPSRALRHFPSRTKAHCLQRGISNPNSSPPEGPEISAPGARMATMTGGWSPRRETPNHHSPQAAFGKRKSGGSWENSGDLDLSRDFRRKKRDLKRGKGRRRKGSWNMF